MAEREQRLVFGEVAEQYDRARPGYPRQVVDDIVAITGIQPPARVLEVGSGTGKATPLFVDAGFEVVCLEPNADMAAVAGRKFDGVANVTIEVGLLEDWPAAGDFDLVTAAQAFHWVDHDVRLPKSAACLRPGGALAVFWNWDMGPSSPQLRAAVDDAYETKAPSMVQEPMKARVGDVIAEEIEASDLFGPVERRSHAWRRRFTVWYFGAPLGAPKYQTGQRKSKATLMAPVCSWRARAENALRQSSSGNVCVSMPVRSMRPSSTSSR